MDDSERRYWVALSRAPEFGSRRCLALLERCGGPANLFTASPRSLEIAGASPALLEYLRAPDWSRIDRDLTWLDQPRRHCITIADDAYPALLREIPAPPALLFVEGDAGLLSARQIAMVGSRNPSPYGQRVAFRTAAEVATCGYAVTSGLALGIDAAGHRGSLSVGGKTVAVLGTGLDQTYPRSHQALREEIAATGAVVSDFPLGTRPLAANFPRRNRLISGLSLGTLVVEAALRSGSLITARLAAEQGREVFAIPGSIDNPLARGCHQLIRQGAKLVEDVADILEELGGFVAINSVAAEPGGSPTGLDTASRELLKYVACGPTSVDTLIAATGFSAEQTASLLVMLELQGYVASSAGGHYCKIV
jgi:DNA processing protein